jgi:hypothetical protein
MFTDFRGVGPQAGYPAGRRKRTIPEKRVPKSDEIELAAARVAGVNIPSGERIE